MGSFLSTEQVFNLVDSHSRQFYTRENVTLTERFVVGFTFLLLSTAAMLLQLSFLVIFSKYADYYRNACYRCMAAIAVFDCLQIIAHLYGSFIVLFNNAFNRSVEETFGALSNAAFVTLMPLEFALALNRLLILIDWPVHAHLCDALVGASAVWGTLFLAAGRTAYFRIRYRRYEWAYDRSLHSVKIMEFAEEATESVFITLAFTGYILSFLVCLVRRGGLKLKSNAASHQEFLLLVQCFILFLGKGSLIIIWHARGTLYKSTVDNTIICTAYWMLTCAITPIVYFSFNIKLRRRVLNFFHDKRSSVVQRTSRTNSLQTFHVMNTKNSITTTTSVLNHKCHVPSLNPSIIFD